MLLWYKFCSNLEETQHQAQQPISVHLCKLLPSAQSLNPVIWSEPEKVHFDMGLPCTEILSFLFAFPSSPPLHLFQL